MRAITFLILFFSSLAANAELASVATWNMKWLGTPSGSQLDPVESVPDYADQIEAVGSSIWALQEIGASHSVGGLAKNYYLDLIVAELDSRHGSNVWKYLIDEVNKTQRLAFLYRDDLWSISDSRSIRPGASYNHIRRPLVARFTSISDPDFEFDFINVHFKAFPDATDKRENNIAELISWIAGAGLDAEYLIAGDTNIYKDDDNADIEKPFRDAGITPVSDQEITSIHNNKLSQRFDRFYRSAGFLDEFDAAKVETGSSDLVDAHKKNTQAYIDWFDANISDHFPVRLYFKK